MNAAETARGLYVLNAFLDARALGRAELQRLCDAWAATREAADLGVAALTVGAEEAGMPLLPVFRAPARPLKTDPTYPMLRALFAHIIEHGLPDDRKPDARRFAALLPKDPEPLPNVPPPAGWSRL